MNPKLPVLCTRMPIVGGGALPQLSLLPFIIQLTVGKTSRRLSEVLKPKVTVDNGWDNGRLGLVTDNVLSW